jgi:dihydrolipoamide dehydrogenase
VTTAGPAAAAAKPAERNSPAPVLVSVNVGMPKDVPWQGKTVHTGVWKYPVHGPAMEAGVATERGFVVVDENCRTGAPRVSAVGDLTLGPQLAHVGFAEGILVAERVSGLPVTPINYDGVPRIAYSDPEVASVGITSATAAARGIETVEVNYPLGANSRSVILRTQGAAKVIATAPADGDSRPGPVLGIHLVGARAGELIAEGQLIYNWETAPADVAQLIHPPPTQSEIIGEAHLALAGRPLHFHPADT